MYIYNLQPQLQVSDQQDILKHICMWAINVFIFFLDKHIWYFKMATHFDE